MLTTLDSVESVEIKSNDDSYEPVKYKIKEKPKKDKEVEANKEKDKGKASKKGEGDLDLKVDEKRSWRVVHTKKPELDFMHASEVR
jgi:hypothetical protein